MKKCLIAALALVGIGIGCATVTPIVIPPITVTMRAVAVVVTDGVGRKAGALVTLNDITPPGPHTDVTGLDGVVTFPMVSGAIRSTQVSVKVFGCQDYVATIELTENISQQVNIGGPQTTPNAVQAPALNCHVDPSRISLLDRSRIKGAMWTTRMNLPYGPRPNQDSNILAMPFYGLYDAGTRERMLTQYHDVMGYTHAVTGPITGNDCYHGLYPCRQGVPTQEQWDAYLDELQEWHDSGITPVYFAKPDGCEQSDACMADMDRLDALYRQPRAQQLLTVVVYPGWEPNGSKYGWPNATWVYWVKRGADVFPNALRLLHMSADLDAPTGGNDDRTFPAGQGNALSWQRVAPYIHGVLYQVGGYVDGSSPQPSSAFLVEFAKLFKDFHRKFTTGAAGWPTFSAFGPTTPLKFYYAEGASYGDFWKDWPESVAIMLGNLAMMSDADGCLDSCSAPVR